MKTKPRITSILKASSLDSSITGFQSFDLSELDLTTDLEIQLPTNLRLGHLIEKIVSEMIKSSNNYRALYENLQVLEDKRTIGEIDFIIENTDTQQLTHIELAYKFYLFDPNISSESINNWIGPNRNDSLKEKLEKLKTKQFPLLYHESTKSKLDRMLIEETSQATCFLVSLFIPYKYKTKLSPVYEKAIKGYYVDFETFITLDDSTKVYYIPSKKEWGIEPSENETWIDFDRVEKQISTSINDKQAPLCWQKDGDSYSAFFIVWW